MKQLEKSEIQQIKSYLESNGLEYEEVLDDVLDHICCELEEMLAEGKEFNQAFAEVQEVFSPEEVNTIQSDTTYFLTIKKTITMIKGIFITGYISVALYALAFGLAPFFSFIFHGTELSFMLTGIFKLASVSTFCFGFLPLLFMYGYKRFTKQLIS